MKSALMPIPRIGDNARKTRVAWFPAENSLRIRGVADQRWRISGPRGTASDWYLPTGSALDFANDLAHRAACRCTQIQRDTTATLQQIVERRDMRSGNVTDMNIITNRRSIQ